MAVGGSGGTRVVQITNIAPQATKDQMQTLFGYLGKIDDIRLYPTIRDVSCPVQSRICYVKFIDTSTVGIAQHMTNTVFIDRALIVIPVQNGEIPDEHKALEMTNNGTIVPGLYPAEPKLPPNVVNSVEGVPPNHVIRTHDPQLELNGLPAYPPLPASYDSRKIEEVRRTLLVTDPDPSVSTDDLIDLFTEAGEVKYLRTCARNQDGGNHILMEFTEQPSIIPALKLNGRSLKGRVVNVSHATQPIVKPQAKSNEAAQKEIEEAMSRVKEAQSLISAAIDPVIGMLSKDKRSSRRSRSRSRGRRRRSRSRSRSRRRSRSRHRTRRSRSRSHSKRSRSKERKRRSRSHRRTRSRSRSRRSSRSRKSRSKSRSKSSRSKNDREKERAARSKDRDRDRDRDRDKRKDDDDKKTRERKRSRSRSRHRTRSRERKRSRSRDRKRSRSRDRSRRKSASPRASRKRSRSPKHETRDKERKKDKKEKKEKDYDKESAVETAATKVPRNYDEEEKGFDSEKDTDKNGDNKNHESADESSQDSGTRREKDSSEKSDNMDISNSP